MKILTSRKGFTLIELLVVIGILAVLAAIAIPSVAGLIDRANVSSDATNSNEMTNAMERFASEYELYRQDISSGLIKDVDGDGRPDNLDAAQGRVFNVTGAMTHEDIEKLESLSGLNGVRIDIDTKYAQNQNTARAVIKNYMKTSSSTFEPKQSDMAYWYHKVTGYTVVAPLNTGTQYLVKQLPSEINYGVTDVASLTEWICLTVDETVVFPDVAIVSMSKSSEGTNSHTVYFNTVYAGDQLIQGDCKLWVLLDLGLAPENLTDLSIQNAAMKQDMTADYNDPTKKESYVSVYEIPNAYKDTDICVRFCFEYKENGQIKYLYGPAVAASFNDIKNVK